MNLRTFAFLTTCLLASLGYSQVIAAQNRYATPGPLEISAVRSARDAAGNIFVTGESGAFAPYSSGLVVTQKFNSSGVLQWRDGFDLAPDTEAFPEFMYTTASGQVFVFGYTYDEVKLKSSLFFRFLSATGALLWSFTDPTVNDVGGVAFDSIGNPILTETTSNGVNVVKYNLATHKVMWSKPQTYGTTRVLQFAAGDSAGHCYEMLVLDGKTYHLVKINPTTGNADWHRDYTNATFQSFRFDAGVVLASGDLLVQGSASDTAFTYSVSTLDRVNTTTGTATYRKVLGPATAKMFATLFGTAVTDGSNQLYFTLRNYDAAKALTTLSLNKISATGTALFSSPLPNSYTDVLLAPTSSGGLYVAPSTTGNPRTFRLLNSAGTLQWSASAGPLYVPQGGSIFVDPANNLLYVNTTQDPLHERRIGMMKLDGTTHATVFDQRTTTTGIMNSSFRAIAGKDASGNIFVVGSENFTPFAAKLSPTGQVLWKTIIGASSPWFAGSQIADATYSPTQGLALAVGSDLGTAVARVNNLGHVIWTTTHRTVPGETNPARVLMDESGNVTVASTEYGHHVVIDQYSSGKGVIKWAKSYDLSLSDFGLAMDASGDVYFASVTTDQGHVQLAKINSSGVQIFANSISIGTNRLFGMSLDLDTSSGDLIVATGDTELDTSMVSQGALQIVRFSSDGAVIWTRTMLLSGYYGPSNLLLKVVPSRASFYVSCSAQGKTHGQLDEFIKRVSLGAGSTLWTNFYSFPGAANQQNYLDADIYGNAILTGSYGGIYLNWSYPYFRKVDAGSGATRYTSTSQGAYTTLFTFIDGVAIGPDNQPIIVGAAPSQYGPGVLNSLFVKYASPPTSFPDFFTTKKNIALANAKVGLNDEDVRGATFKVVKAPTHASKFVLAADGTVTYTPALNYVGTDTFTYNGTTVYGTGTTATVTITVTP